jgi:hypothetical protein
MWEPQRLTTYAPSRPVTGIALPFFYNIPSGLYLNSDVLRWISVGLFLPEEPSSHVAPLWRGHVMFYRVLSSNNCYFATMGGKKRNCFIKLLPIWKGTWDPAIGVSKNELQHFVSKRLPLLPAEKHFNCRSWHSDFSFASSCWFDHNVLSLCWDQVNMILCLLWIFLLKTFK